jgi:glyoxylase-like metal-dependent hydrolase (beta-lactamase superfamily II)
MNHHRHGIDRLMRSLQCDFSRRALLGRAAGGATLAVLAGGVRTGLGLAQEAAGAGFQRFRVGAFDVTAVVDGTLGFPNDFFPGSASEIFFVDAPPAELEAALREAGLEAWVETPETASGEIPFTPLLVNTGRELVLLDTGFGTSAGMPGAGLLIERLAAAGVEAGEIDVVVISHAHPDHILGAIDGTGKILFPNARFVMGRTEHAFWTDDAWLAEVFPDQAMREGVSGPALAALAAIAANLDLIDDAAEEEIVPGIRAIAAHGHTPGHMAILVSSDDDHLLATFDTVIHPLHVTYPAWNFVGDTLLNQTETSRRGLLDRAAAEQLRIAAYHVPFPGLGRVVRDGEALVWEAE